MAKKILLESGTSFKSISAANMHFSAILESTAINHNIVGPNSVDIMTIYKIYCDVTAWHLASPPVEFFPVYEVSENYTTRCFGVRFENGTVDRFSMKKALSKIAQ